MIPRIRSSNVEMLRYELLEMLARIKVSKISAWRKIRRPCKNKDLVAHNKMLLYPRDQIPESEYLRKLTSFGQTRAESLNETDPVESRLNIPGKVIHLVRETGRSGNFKNKYIPYWESSYALREIELSLEVMVSTYFVFCPILSPTALISEFNQQCTE